MWNTKIRKINRLFLTFGLVYGVCLAGFSQDKPTLNYLHFSYGAQLPLADMRDRFGGNNEASFAFEKANVNHKIFAGAEFRFFFGSNVKEDVITSLRSFDGNIIGVNGSPADVNLKERGYYTGIYVGKIFSTTPHHTSLTGFRLQFGAGLMQHKIRVQDNSNTVPQLNKEFLHGYDRLSNGMGFHLGLGFQTDNPLNNAHFKLMWNTLAGFTQSRRDFEFGYPVATPDKRVDILTGVNVSYIVTISRVATEKIIYY